MEIIRKRPLILTIICVAGILWSLMNFIFIFSPFIKKISDWAPAIYGVIVALQFISFVGIWHMKRWGVLFYLFSFFLKQSFTILINDIGISEKVGIGISTLFIVFFLIYYRQMDKEL
ncbi:MAG: hypothetical protein EPN85_10785 [Bacteroidetes bacterium]|nr:MAG: hypothetical protein EPN85_10785 [Bacteroidota bacterium]